MLHRKLVFLIATALLLLAATHGAASANAQTPTLVYNLQEYFALVRKESPEIFCGVHVTDLDGGGTIFSESSRERYIPASLLKVLTTLASLKILGGSYRFPTEVFLDALPRELGEPGEVKVDFAQPPTVVGNMYVRGYGDPTFDTHRMEDLAQSLRRYGVKEVKDVVIDDSLFHAPPRAASDKPHDAGLSAVTVNFNSYGVAVAPGRLGRPAEVSLPDGTPYTLLNLTKTVRGTAQEIEIYQSPGAGSSIPGADDADRIFLGERSKVQVTVQGSVGHRSSGATYYRSVPDAPEYFASLLKFNLERSGLKVKGAFRRGETPSAAKLLQTIESDDLSTILRQLNHSSNNVVAGQLVFAIGQDANGYFRYDRGLTRLVSELEALGESPDGFEIYDGSGLDKRNQMNAEQIVKILAAGYKDFSLGPDFVASLSRFGQSGTLKSRELLDREFALRLRGTELEETRARSSAVWGKTGTLDSVSSLAGFAESQTGARLAFAIVLNGVPDKERAVRIENDFVKLLIGLPVAALAPKAVPLRPRPPHLARLPDQVPTKK